MKIYELLDRDPRTGRLANNGQARITGKADAAALEEVRAELETFVCEGQFSDAIQRIFESYLRNLGSSRQDSAWVSGFYGSGKSHLLKMLSYLWVNTPFKDGSTPRSLVRAGLPDEVEAQLRELDIQAKRSGRPAVAAAGTLLGGSVDHVRHTVLSILLRSRGWPSQYPQAMFCFWLREQGLLEEMRAAVEKKDKDWLKELNNLYVSPVIARALLEADSNFAADEKSARQVLVQQYPQLSTDISTEQFIEASRKALSDDDQLPLTIVVLDEVQQYINEAADRASTITEVAEALQTQFDSRVLLVGAGQSALSAGTPALMWLRDRFRISVELTDADVEAVTRTVVLRKKPSAVPQIEEMLDDHSGEIARHLRSTKIASRPIDRTDGPSDYPLLPTRRRFWEACFQAADAAGTHSQLRSQLRILHDSLHDIAEADLGAAIPASDLFIALAPSLVNTGVLLNEINTRIQKLDDETDAGRLRRDLCGLAFLIGKLPREEGLDIGVRADATTLADLMVEDVGRDSGPFRKQVEEMLNRLADEGVLMKVGDEFRLQTTEGAEWDRAFRERQAALRNDEVEISTRRDHAFGSAVQTIVSDIKLTHGEAKLRRTLAMHIGSEPPQPGGDQVVVWVRDGWSCSLKDVESEAQRLGQEDATLHVQLPKKSADDLRSHLIDAEAARRVLDHKGVPATPEGREARDSMESRLRNAEITREEIVRDIIRSAKLFQGGGTEVFGEGLDEKIRTGATASLARLFKDFDKGDHRAWEAAVRRAKDGSDTPFKVVGHDGPTEEHAVAKEVLNKAGKWTRGSEIQKELKAASYGWPQDAIDAALIALHRGGQLRARRSKNNEPIPAGSLDQAGVKAAEFKQETVILTTTDRIALRGLFTKVIESCHSGEEEIKAPFFLDAAKNLASGAGGQPPLPPPPQVTLLEDLERLTGTEQLRAILENKGELEKSVATWTALGERANRRLPVWETTVLYRLHGDGRPVIDEVGPQLDAVLEQRSLLADSDHITPLAGKLAGALREALTEKHTALTGAVKTAKASLTSDSTWSKLDPVDQAGILETVGLVEPSGLNIATDKQLRASLEARSLGAWQAEIDAVSSRAAKALDEAAEKLNEKDPKAVTTTVTIRRGTLADTSAVEEWLSEHQKKLNEAISKGSVILK